MPRRALLQILKSCFLESFGQKEINDRKDDNGEPGKRKDRAKDNSDERDTMRETVIARIAGRG